MEQTNTILDDICVDIGYTATSTLAGWFGGNYLQVPKEIDRSHPIARAIGFSAAARLASSWGGRRLWIPLAYWQGIDRRDRYIAECLISGEQCEAIASKVGLTARRVQQIRARLVRAGFLDYLRENQMENATGKRG